jgi:hypothetical protein
VTGPDPLPEVDNLAELAVLSSPVVHLACTACQLVYEPDLTAFTTGNTGCPQCGGWTWIAHLGATPPAHFGGGEAR